MCILCGVDFFRDSELLKNIPLLNRVNLPSGQCIDNHGVPVCPETQIRCPHPVGMKLRILHKNLIFGLLGLFEPVIQ